MARIRKRTHRDECKSQKAVEPSIYKREYWTGTVRYQVDKGIDGKRYRKQFNTLEEARKYLLELTSSKLQGREWKGFVYFIKNLDTGHIKVGQAVRPPNRFYAIRATYKSLMTLYGHPEPNLKVLGWTPQSDKINEKLLHAKFSKHRYTGEWFDGCIESKIDKLIKIKPDKWTHPGLI